MSNITTCICDGCGLERYGEDSFPVYYEKFEAEYVDYYWSKVNYCDDCIVPADAVTQPPTRK